MRAYVPNFLVILLNWVTLANNLTSVHCGDVLEIRLNL